VACEDVAGPQARTPFARERRKQPVADRVTRAVVDLLEVVEVDRGDRE